MIVKLMKEFKRMTVQSEKLVFFFFLNKWCGNIKDNQMEMRNIITEMENTLEWINSRLNEREEQISKLEDRVVKINASEQRKEKKKWYEKKWGQFKRPLGQHQVH